MNAEAYLDKMIRLLREDGVKFPDDQRQKFATLDPLEGGILHAEGSWENGDSDRRVAVAFGPQHGPVTVMQVATVLYVQHASTPRYTMTLFLRGSVLMVQHKLIIQDDLNPEGAYPHGVYQSGCGDG